MSREKLATTIVAVIDYLALFGAIAAAFYVASQRTEGIVSGIFVFLVLSWVFYYIAVIVTHFINLLVVRLLKSKGEEI